MSRTDDRTTIEQIVGEWLAEGLGRNRNELVSDLVDAGFHRCGEPATVVETMGQLADLSDDAALEIANGALYRASTLKMYFSVTSIKPETVFPAIVLHSRQVVAPTDSTNAGAR
jgi:hypothetical protein